MGSCSETLALVAASELQNVRISSVNAQFTVPAMIKTSENMTSLVDSDTEPLFGGNERKKCSGRCWILTSISIAFCLGVIFLGYNFYWKDVVGLRVMSYNTWGIPHTFGSQDEEERMEKIGQLLAEGDYDIVLLEKNFTQFKQQGPFSHMFSDGEYFSGKGVGRVSVSPKPGITIDVFVTHTISEDNNYEIREKQADELLGLVENSKADFIILGGDFNASPLMDFDKTYHKVKKVMTDAFQEIMESIKAWMDEEYATFANPRNTCTGREGKALTPVIYDYIFHKKNTEGPAMIWTKWFFLPFLKTVSRYENNTISLSDHEAVTSHLYIWKQERDDE